MKNAQNGSWFFLVAVVLLTNVCSLFPRRILASSPSLTVVLT
ncbi:hypothetical protein U0070_023264 [Myodes glareolus]|uniref:ATPase subunit 6 n=1 Tax=Myodes glareolus TaxID=447135 RepID=A0AAW0IDV1_MYOGA